MNSIGVIGAGTMGSGIAQVAATAGCRVIVIDQNEVILQRAHEKLEKTLKSLSEKGKMAHEEATAILNRFSFHTDLSKLTDCELVIEAIVEKKEVKTKLFQDLEAVVNKNCILASNTSSLSIASIAAACQQPGRCIGLHFFNPAPLMALVEVIPAVQTDNEVFNLAMATMKAWGKLPVKAKDTPGFIVNRVARPYYGEAIRIMEEGLADCATIDWAMKTLGGFRMGPFELMDFIGHDVNFTVTETIFQSFYFDPRYLPSFSQKRLLEAGFLGRKSGKGFYNYDQNAPKNEPDTDPVKGKEIVDRILAMLINEAADAVHFGIAGKEEIDLAMVKAVNYPKGLLAWAEDIGFGTIVQQLDNLFDWYHDTRYRCSPWLRKMAKTHG